MREEPSSDGCAASLRADVFGLLCLLAAVLETWEVADTLEASSMLRPDRWLALL